jgi:hypothetical protein
MTTLQRLTAASQESGAGAANEEHVMMAPAKRATAARMKRLVWLKWGIRSANGFGWGPYREL